MMGQPFFTFYRLEEKMIRIMFETDVLAPLSTIWRHFVEERLRMKWEVDLESIVFDGPVASGTRGTMKLAGMPAIPFLLSRIDTEREFTDEVDVPDMGKLEFKHEMFASGTTNHIRQTVTLTPLSEVAVEKEHGFFRTVTGDIAETVWRLKRAVDESAARQAFP